MGESSGGGTTMEGSTSKESDWESDGEPEDMEMGEVELQRGPTLDLPVFLDKVVARGYTPEPEVENQ